MKKKLFLFVLMMLIFPAIFLFTGCDANKDVEIRVSGEYVQWSYQGENLWHDLIDTASIKSMLGNTYKGDKGDQGDQGLQGAQGIAGKQVEFRRTEQNIEWHYVGEDTWQFLISVEELKTDTSQDSNPQQLAFYPLDDGTYGVGVGNATQLSSITIPETYLGKPVTKIVDKGFLICDKLRSLDIPNCVISIGESAFSGCKLLTNITIPKDITIIADYAFSGCNSLTDITIPNSVTSIGGYAFYRCSSLESITIPDGVVYIGFSAFTDCNSLENIIVPNSVKTIESGVFFDYDGGLINNVNRKYNILPKLRCNIKNGLKYLGNESNPYLVLVDVEANSLSSYEIDLSTRFILETVFFGCEQLTNITIPNSVTSIGNRAFYNCSSLTSITIPNSVTSIGNRAFYGCSSLTDVVFENVNGWSTYDSPGNYISFMNDDLSNSTTAAHYLINVYRNDWTRTY